jgi:hypothetical protein
LKGLKPMTKTYVLDTNVLLHNPEAEFAFEEHEVVIPFSVIEELDNQKKRQDEIGRNARMVSRILDGLRSSGVLEIPAEDHFPCGPRKTWWQSHDAGLGCGRHGEAARDALAKLIAQLDEKIGERIDRFQHAGPPCYSIIILCSRVIE